MTEKTLGVRLTGDEADLLRAFGAGSAASAQFAATTETTLGRAAAAAERMGASSSQMSLSVNAASAGAQAYATAGDRFLHSLERQTQAIGKTRSELLELRAAELGVASQAAPLVNQLKAQEAALNAVSTALNKHGMSAAQTAAAMRGVPAQITDIVVSLQSGQQPMTVMLQQGGQLKDMFGGIVPAARALGATLMGMINPWTLLAGAAVAFGIAAYQGGQETERLNRTIRLTGNYAGVTAGSIREMSAAAAGVSGGGLGKARQAVEALVATGQISKETISSLSATMLELQRVSGQSMDDISKDFARMPEGVTKWAEEHNRSMNFMSLAQWDYIRTLEETGNREAAMRATSQALHEYLGDEAPRKLGRLERAWRAVKQEVTGAWEAMKQWDQEQDPLEARIATLRTNIARVKERANGPAGLNESGRAQLAIAEARLRDAEEQRALEEAATQVTGLNAAANAAAIEAKRQLLELGLAADKGKQLEAKLAELDDRVARVRAINPDDPTVAPKEVATLKARLRKQYEDKDANSAGQNGISAQLAAMQAQARLREEALRQENTRLEGERARGLLSEEQFIHRRAEAQRAALQDELEVVRKQAEVAGGKKQLAERERYLARVKELEAQIVRSHEQEATDIEKYQEKIRGAVRATELDIKNYVGTRDQQVSRQVNAMTLGANDRALVDSINQAQDRFRRIRDGFTDKVLREGGARALDSEQYQQGIAEIDAAMLAQVDRERGYREQRVALQADWKNGAVLALNEWKDSAANLMGQTHTLFSNAFSGMENALVNFVTTGKASFKDFATSVIADLARIAARQAVVGMVGSLVGVLSSGFSAAANYAGAGQAAVGSTTGMSGSWAPVLNAKGGVYDSPSLSAYSNGVYNTPQVFAFAKGAGVFAEAGPEAIMPLQRAADGSLGVRAQIPNWQGQSQGGSAPAEINIITSITIADGATTQQTNDGAGADQSAKQLGDLVVAQVRSTIANELRYGGLLYHTIRRS
ncbi:phage tail tape measure protein [Achromobacter insolitus]|uniref:phage tail tape measure protein n=1 Tax=Achromobacter insolitus TaxID=217204 RepID=UPI0011EB99F2|nr:phage tail tape measure protein [Achromobacter insolitus]QEK91909.1 phage tail tape measure protein [Achromobacter insolitus]